MCTYLHTRGRRYYFRRAVPTELAPFILTASGQPRLEWMVSLGTSDRATAKRLIPEHTIRTEAMLTEVRAKLVDDDKPYAETPPSKRSRFASNYAGPTPQEQELMALFDSEARQREWRYEDREEARKLLEQRFRGTTASLSPIEAAARDLVRTATYDRDTAKHEAQALRHDKQERDKARAAVALAELVAVPGSKDRTKGTMLGIIIERWHAERKVTTKTRAAAEASVRWFYERVTGIAGSPFGLGSVAWAGGQRSTGLGGWHGGKSRAQSWKYPLAHIHQNQVAGLIPANMPRAVVANLVKHD